MINKNELESLVANVEDCEVIYLKYPKLKTSLSWFRLVPLSYYGAEISRHNQNSYWFCDTTDSFELGLSYFKMKWVEKIVPAYTLSDLYSINNKAVEKDVKKLGKIIAK